MQDTDYQLFASSVEELSLGMKDDCKEKVDETLKALELSDYRERHPASLSGGQKQGYYRCSNRKGQPSDLL